MPPAHPEPGLPQLKVWKNQESRWPWGTERQLPTGTLLLIPFAVPFRAAPPATPRAQSRLELPHGRRPVIAVDMDEVIADALAEHLLRYNRDAGTAHTVADLHGRYLWDLIPPQHHSLLAAYMASADFFSVLRVIPRAQDVLERLQARFDIFIATAAMEVPTSFAAKFAWLAEHFPFIPPSHIVFCGDKSILRADFLIDDNPRQLQRFEGRVDPGSAWKPRGILYTSPANVNVVGFQRVADWQEIETLFLSSLLP